MDDFPSKTRFRQNSDGKLKPSRKLADLLDDLSIAFIFVMLLWALFESPTVVHWWQKNIFKESKQEK